MFFLCVFCQLLFDRGTKGGDIKTLNSRNQVIFVFGEIPGKVGERMDDLTPTIINKYTYIDKFPKVL